MSADFAPYFPPPSPLTEAQIHNLIKRFATSASLAEQAGFDGVQIHGAHGYLVSQFLSPLTNQRTDDWGGTPENRRRFPVEIARAIRAATSPGFGVAIKINSADFQRGGFTDILEILGDLSDCRERKKCVIFTYGRMPLDDHVRLKYATFSNSNVSADDTVSADLHAVGNLCGGVDDCSRMNHQKINYR